MKSTLPLHRMYIDEVGNPGLGRSDHPNNRYLSLTGLISNLSGMTALESDIVALKQRYFGTGAVIFHRNDMERGNAAFQPLLDPQIRQSFNQEITSLLASWHFALVTVCIDKVSYYRGQGPKHLEPYSLSMSFLLEEYAWFLEETKSYGDVMLEARGKAEDIKLETEFLRMWKQGIRGKNLQSVLTSKHLKTKLKSSNEAGLQMVDLLAYPSQCELLREQGVTIQTTELTDRLIAAIQGRYYSRLGANGKIFIK